MDLSQLSENIKPINTTFSGMITSNMTLFVWANITRCFEVA